MLKNKISALAALLILTFVILGCGGTKPEMPNDAAVQSLVKATTADFTDAVDKGDFGSLRDKASADFQSQFSNDALKTAFKDYTDHKDLIVPILKSANGMTPTFAPATTIREEKGNYILVVNGSYATEPAATGINYEYVWRDNAWKLLTIKLNVK